MLALPRGDNEDSKVFCSFTLSEHYRKKIEPAGKYFEELLISRLDRSSCDIDFEEFVKTSSSKKLTIEEDTVIYEWEKEYYENLRSNKESLNSVKDNFYSILGLDALFINASIDDIRKAYKKMVVLYHPDKNQENTSLLSENNENQNKVEEVKTLTTTDEFGEKRILTEEEQLKLAINKKWLKIKDAYDTLIDPEKRKKYDSTFEFDDTIPHEDDEFEDKKFFKTFGPYFIKNSIWSKNKPIPKLGDLKTPMIKIQKFYQFWYSFESWRDFAVDGEYNLDGKILNFIL